MTVWLIIGMAAVFTFFGYVVGLNKGYQLGMAMKVVMAVKEELLRRHGNEDSTKH